MKMIFSGKVAVITGAGSGIGRALAIALAQRGAQLALSDINEVGLLQTVAALPDGSAVRSYVLDVTRQEAVVAHAEDVVREFGGAHLLFNNAGSALLGTFEHQTLDEAEWLIELDLWSVVFATKAFLPIMQRQGEGWIVNISSIAGLVGLPALNTYNVVKFAVRGLTESLWSELDGTGVHAVCVHPGGIRTNIEQASRHTKYAGEAEQKMDRANRKILVTPPERCAEDILNALARGKRRILTGKYSRVMDWLARGLPNSYPALIQRLL